MLTKPDTIIKVTLLVVQSITTELENIGVERKFTGTFLDHKAHWGTC